MRDLKRVQTIIEMKKRRATLEAISLALDGLSQEYARQLVARVAQERGEDVFKPDEPLWSTKEAADALGVSHSTVTLLCANGEVPCRRRGLQEYRSSYLIDEAGMERLRRHPKITGEKACVICGGTFVAKAKGRNKALTCSQKCRRERVSQWRASHAAREPTLDSLEGWRKEVWLALQRHRIPEDEAWLSVGGAARRSGLTLAVVWRLKRRKIVTTRAHPTKTWRGRPILTYAASQMEIVRRVYAENH